MIVWSVAIGTCCCFFFMDTATTEIYTLSLHDALPIYHSHERIRHEEQLYDEQSDTARHSVRPTTLQDRKSTRLNSSHSQNSYAVFCLKKNKKQEHAEVDRSRQLKHDYVHILEHLRTVE